MKNFKKIMAGALMLSMLFSFTACGKKIEKIDDGDLTDAMEDELGWDEDDEYREHKDYEIWGTNFDDVDDPYIYDLDSHIQGMDDSLFISYSIFDDEEEAEEYFLLYYDVWAKDNKEVPSKYSKNNYGYFIEYVKQDDAFHAYYYAEDMVLEVAAYEKDDVKDLVKFLKAIGYPVK